MVGLVVANPISIDFLHLVLTREELYTFKYILDIPLDIETHQVFL